MEAGLSVWNGLDRLVYWKERTLCIQFQALLKILTKDAQ